MDRFPSLDVDDFSEHLLTYDPTLWVKMERSLLFQHMRHLPSDGTSLAGGPSLAEMWFDWWLKNDDELSPLLESTPGDGALIDLLNARYSNSFDIFGIGEYEFVKDVARKVPDWVLAHSLWKTRPDPERLREAGEFAAQVSIMLADGFSFEQALGWTAGAGRFAPSNPSGQIHRYRALTSAGVSPESALDLLLAHGKRHVWQILLINDGMPPEYVDALGQ